MLNTSKKIDIWIFQTGEPLPSELESRSMRLSNLYKIAKRMGENVLIISTNFNHSKKKFREKSNNLLPFILKKDVVLIKSPGYKHNISILRIFDHIVLALNLLLFLILSKRYFRKPTISFIGFPPIEWAFISVLWSKFNKIKNLVDIKDLWPEIFYENKKGFKKVLLYIFCLPYSFLKHLTLFLCDKVCLPTKSYARECLKIHPKLYKTRIICPLVPPEDFKYLNNDVKKNSKIPLDFDGLSVIFIGSLMATAYDFDKVFSAIFKFKKENSYKKIRLFVCGDGPLYSELEKKISGKFLNKEVILLGWVNREEMYEIARFADVAIAPYKNIVNYRGHLPNKIIDYLQLGLPIISSLKVEFQDLIQLNEIGFFYENVEDLIRILDEITKHKNSKLKEYKLNSRKLWENNYRIEKVYENLINNLRNM